MYLEINFEMEADVGAMWPKPASSHQKLEKAGTDSPPTAHGGRAGNLASFLWSLDFRFLAFRTVRE